MSGSRGWPCFRWAVYVWVSGVALLSLFWCTYNQRLFPLGKTALLRDMDNVDPQLRPTRTSSNTNKKIDLDTHSERLEEEELMCTQTGYRTYLVGTILYGCILLTVLGFQVLLLLLCLSYYSITDGILGGPFFFKDEKQALLAFEVLWVIATVWWVFLKWPTSLYSLFLRRCPLTEAEYVAVFTEEEEGTLLSKDNEATCLVWSKALVYRLNSWINSFCRVLFSDRSRPPGRQGQVQLCTVEHKPSAHVHTPARREFRFRLCQYVLDPAAGLFTPGRVTAGETLGELAKGANGLTTLEVLDRLSLVGPNEIHLEDPSFLSSLGEEFAKIFYIYQNMITWTWFNFNYWYMGLLNTVVYVSGGLSVAWYTYQNKLALASLAKIEGQARVKRDGRWLFVDQRNLVPGDVCQLEPGIVQCDCVLLSHPAVADESSLTGESMPVVKVPLQEASLDLSEKYDPTKHKKFTIFAGTSLLKMAGAQGEHRCEAIVTRTGAQTAKGELLRNILFSTPPRFSFDVEIELVLFLLLGWAILAFCTTYYFLETDPVSAWFFGMYVVCTCLPPLLPTVFVVAVGISSQRLLKQRVVCTDPKRLLMAGKVRVAAFDKTGTLTKQGLDLLAVRTCKDGAFAGYPNYHENLTGLAEKTATSTLAKAMAVCHTLSMVQSHSDSETDREDDEGKREDDEGKRSDQGEQGALVGNSVDVQMFRASGYSLHVGLNAPDRVQFNTPDHQTPEHLVLLQRFDFDHRLMTQSSIVKDDSKDSTEKGRHFVYAKGSAEAIKARCRAESLPDDYDKVAEGYSKQGLYVIAISRKELQSHERALLSSGDQKQNREQVESDLTFLGFLLFKNELQPDTIKALQDLRQGDVRTLMVSGDHVLTAIHVGKECQMVPPGHQVLLGKLVPPAVHDQKGSGSAIVWEDESGQQVDLPDPDQQGGLGKVELAITGSVFNALEESGQLDSLLISIRIFARMTPADKVRVVQHYVNKGWIILFCGDGGNDCGALRTAHVGVALSNTEASVVSPFTALDKSCRAVVDVMLAGRCALSGSFSSYKYMLIYGQVETLNQMTSAHLFVTFTEWCWVWMDGVWLMSMAFALPLAEHSERLAKSRPTSSLLGPYTLVSFMGILLINFSFVWVALGLLYKQDWYGCRQWTSHNVSNALFIGDNYESSVIFIISGWQYVASACAFNFGGQHRAGWIANYRFVALVVVFFILHVYITLVPSRMSCLFRVNCDNDKVVPMVTLPHVPIQNAWHTTVMPLAFRVQLVVLILVNTVLVMLWERLVVLGTVGDWFRAKHPRKRYLNL
eukprot:g7208.t1